MFNLKGIIIVFLLTLSMLNAQDNTGTVTDIDGNVYKSVKIGNQWWMAENLNVGSFKNGDPIHEAHSMKEWREHLYSLKCGYYANNPDNGKIYGKLYNWVAVNDPRGLAPEGWHVPTDEEWQILADFLGGEEIAGKKLKSTSGWEKVTDKDGNGDNSSGFTALPGGLFDASVVFQSMGAIAIFWSSTNNGRFAWRRDLHSWESEFDRVEGHKSSAYSIRLIKD